MSETSKQRDYYASTAVAYDTDHAAEMRDLTFSIHTMLGMSRFLGVNSILDIGSGTGRLLTIIKQVEPTLLLRGIEPVAELRRIAVERGLDVIDGDALQLPYGDGEFDLVCQFAVLHHIAKPELVVSEMLRVAKKGIFLSDSNNFGQGSTFARVIKQAANSVGLWPLLDKLKTRGKGFTESEGDGIAYSYSVYNNLKQIEQACDRVHLVNIAPSGPNPYRTAASVALLGIKK